MFQTFMSLILVPLQLHYKLAYAPVIWSRVPETALPPRQLYRAVICENVVSVGRVKVLAA